MRLSELRQKEVINIFTCNSLGCVCDVDFDDRNGCIRFLIIPGPGRFCGVFGRDTEFFIPWNSIRQIGIVIILVEVEEKKCVRKCE